MEPPPEPEPEPQSLSEASAAAPLRAPEVARLREEQEKVTGRARFPSWPASAYGRDGGSLLGRHAGAAQPRACGEPGGETFVTCICCFLSGAL